MMKKRIVSLALAVSMAGSLTACGGGAAKTENKETEAAADTTAAKAEETEAAADGKTHLKWAMWDKDLTVYYKALVEAYEKAHPDVFNVLLQVLDDGRITDSQGRTVDFKNTIIIMTSNIGSTYLLDGIDENGGIKQETEDLVMNDLRGHFRPEFLNRLDEIILFKPLTKDNIGNIIHLLIADVNRRLADKELQVRLTDAAESYITEHGFDPMYGARPLKRYVQKTVETLAAKLILKGDINTGDDIVIDVVNGELTARAEGRKAIEEK